MALEIGNRSSLWMRRRKCIVYHELWEREFCRVARRLLCWVFVPGRPGEPDCGFGIRNPHANPTDVLLPTSQAGAAANPTFPWYDLLTASGDQAEISSDIPPAARPRRQRIESTAAPVETTPTPATSTNMASPSASRREPWAAWPSSLPASRPATIMRVQLTSSSRQSTPVTATVFRPAAATTA